MRINMILFFVVVLIFTVSAPDRKKHPIFNPTFEVR
jgi:hypothetical protein